MIDTINNKIIGSPLEAVVDDAFGDYVSVSEEIRTRESLDGGGRSFFCYKIGIKFVF